METMTYDTVARFSMVASLLLFIGLFLIVLAYVFWPTASARLETAQRRALDLDTNGKSPGGRA